MVSEVLYSKHIHDFRTQSKYKISFTIEQSSKNSAHSLFFFPFFLHILIKSSLNNKNMQMDADAIYAMAYCEPGPQHVLSLHHDQSVTESMTEWDRFRVLWI